MASYSSSTEHHVLRIASACNKEVKIGRLEYARYTITDHLTSHVNVI